MDQRAAAACSNLLSLPESVDFKWIRLSWQPCLATIDGLHLKPKRSADRDKKVHMIL